jgi:hypothetical protein
MMYVSANEKAVSLCLHRYITASVDSRCREVKDYNVCQKTCAVGLCRLNQVDT